MSMRVITPGVWLLAGIWLLSTIAAASQKQFQFTIKPGATITVSNPYGPVTVEPAPGNQAVISATTYSDKAEANATQTGNRVEVHTRILQGGNDKDGRVDYQLKVPTGTSVTIRTGTGPLQVRGLRGEVTAQCESGQVNVSDMKDAHLQVRTASGAVTLSNVANTYLEVTSIGGAVTLNNVSGPKVSVNTANGPIRYSGSAESDGSYSLTSHSGNIDVILPAAASVDLSARSVSGTVGCDLALKPNTNASFPNVQGRAVSGIMNSGGSSLRMVSFSGNITVKKQ